ncbi:MAG: tetratricopeptide repeat protein [Candidatus Hydrogenedentes bacterium]|nr:tetratricopeptide repeat protein [Candidatus Hydrogenedentota bacterium]
MRPRTHEVFIVATMINCPYCGKLTDPQLDSCVHCGGFLKKQSARPQRKSSAPSQTCPSCGALVRDGDIICVACGTNLLTGQKIAEERKKTVETRSPTTLIVSIVAAAVIVLLGGIVIFLLTRDPVARAQKLSAAGRTTEALSILETHLAKKPEDPRAQFELGKLHWSIGDYDPAAKAFTEANRLDPKNREAGIYAVLSHAENKTGAGRSSQIAVLENMVKQDPADAEAQYLLGLARGASGDYVGQVDALQQASRSSGATAALQEALGVGLALDKQYPAAESELQAALKASPGDGDVLAALGTLSSLRGDDQAAGEYLRGAVKAQSIVGQEALTRLGLLAIEEGKYPEARELLGQALQARADDRVAQYFRAVCLARMRATEQAIAAFEEISAGQGPFAAKASIHLARLYLAQQTPDRGLEAINRITASLDGTAGAELETVRGRIHQAMGEIESAQDAFRKAGQMDASYPPVHLENGILQVSRGNVAEGIRELERYLELVNPEDPESGAKEVQGLINQLKQSAQAPAGATAASRETQGGVS